MPRQPLQAFFFIAASACAVGSTPNTGNEPKDEPDDFGLRLNELQAKGTHNSYHIEPEFPLDDSHRYTHAPLDVQLDAQGVRQFELDLHYRVDRGFEVFHLPGIDEETTCETLVACLTIVRDWSLDHPYHVPIMIWLEPKDDIDDLIPDLLPISGRYDELEADILSVLAPEHILTPDDVRGDYATLPDALSSDGWPRMRDARGRIMFSLLDDGAHREEYMGDALNLAGKLIFVDGGAPDDPFSAMYKINNPNSDEAKQRVAEGFLVTSNIDGAPGDDEADAAELSAALPGGVHYMSSDFPAPIEGRTYYMAIPNGTPARCNPVTAPATCEPEQLEDRPVAFP